MEELSNRHKNAIKNTFTDTKVQKEAEPQNQLEELNDYLRMLVDMDRIGVRRKIVLIEGFIHMLKTKSK